jgi:UPF0271 protein
VEDEVKVLDAGVFIEGTIVEGVTARSVAEETSVPVNVRVFHPRQEAVEAVKAAAAKTGDLDVLSRADMDVLALAYELHGMVVTNDFAVQNVASQMGIPWEGTGKEIKREIEWEWYCPACWKKYKARGVCEVCGTLTKRRPRKAKTL